MTRHWIAALAVIAMFGLNGKAHAQVGSYTRPSTSPYNRPPVSPYVNLGSGHGSTATNLYGIVRPQQEAYNAFQRLQHEVDAPAPPPFGSSAGSQMMQQGGSNPRDPQSQQPQGSITGHGVQFFNYGRYYSFKRPGGGQ